MDFNYIFFYLFKTPFKNQLGFQTLLLSGNYCDDYVSHLGHRRHHHQEISLQRHTAYLSQSYSRGCLISCLPANMVLRKEKRSSEENMVRWVRSLKIAALLP